MYTTYEEIVQQQQEQSLQATSEGKFRDRFVSLLINRVNQPPLKGEIIDTPSLSVLAASDYALPWVNKRPQPKSNVYGVEVNADELVAVSSKFQEISRCEGNEVRDF